jgi:hypothetical protein
MAMLLGHHLDTFLYFYNSVSMYQAIIFLKYLRIVPCLVYSVYLG